MLNREIGANCEIGAKACMLTLDHDDECLNGADTNINSGFGKPPGTSLAGNNTTSLSRDTGERQTGSKDGEGLRYGGPGNGCFLLANSFEGQFLALRVISNV